MKPAILLFLLVFAGAGCGVEGEEIARDFSGDCGARFKANTQIYTGMPTMTGFSLPIPGEGLVVECVDGVERYYPDGTFVGRITDRETFEWAHDLWSVC